MHRALLLVPLLLFLPGPAEAQTEVLYAFEVEVPQDRLVIPAQTTYLVDVTFRDKSRDDPSGFVPDGPNVGVFAHRTTWEVEVVSGDAANWIVQRPSPFFTVAGEERTVQLSVLPTTGLSDPYLVLNLTAVTQAGDSEFTTTNRLSFVTHGIAGFSLRGGPGLELEPSEVGQAQVAVFNTGTFRRTFDFTIIDNPCGLRAAPPSTVVVQPRQTKEVAFSVEAPEDRLWYNYASCTLMVGAFASDNPDFVQSTTVGVDVNGVFVDPVWVFWLLAIALIAFALVLLVKRRKERIEEEILGKPQKPWLIPVEQVYLERLKQEDERAWYMVRHYLMEEEYRSALLWYEAEKKGTRATREKERAVLRHERRYKRWQRTWQKRIDAPMREADRLEQKLQRRLEREAEARHKKLQRAHAKEVAKLEAAHEAEEKKALAKWEKQAAKARKKGRAVPEKPVVEPPVLPDEPVLVVPDVEDSKHAPRLQKARAKAERRQGDLEVKYERADAKYRARLGRKVRRLARKIDDPDFVQEHPLLRDIVES